METHTPNFDRARDQFLGSLAETLRCDSPETLRCAPLHALDKKLNEIGFSVNFRSVVERALDAVGNVLDIPSDIVLFYDKLFDIIEYEGSQAELVAAVDSDGKSRDTFPWPPVDMADMSCVVTLNGLPPLTEPSSIARLETLLRDKMLPHVVKDVTTIYLPQDTVEIYPGEGLISRLKGTAFLIFSDANNALAACRALDGFPWLAWVPSVTALRLELGPALTSSRGIEPKLRWMIWRARIFTQYLSDNCEDGTVQSDQTVAQIAQSIRKQISSKKRIHLQVPRVVGRTFNENVEVPRHKRTGGYDEEMLEGSISRPDFASGKKGGKCGKKVRNKIGKSSLRCSVTEENRPDTISSFRIDSGDNDKDKYQTMLDDATQILANVISYCPSVRNSKDVSFPEMTQALNTDIALDENAAGEWCNSPTADTGAVNNDIAISDETGFIDGMSPYQEVVESLIFILTNERSGEHVFQSNSTAAGPDILFAPDTLTEHLEWRGRQRQNEMWTDMERIYCISMIEHDIVGVLQAEIKHNELLQNAIDSESGTLGEYLSDGGYASPSDDEMEMKNCGTDSYRSSRSKSSHHLRDLTHLLEATLEQLQEYVYNADEKGKLGVCGRISIATPIQKEMACRKISVLISSVRTKCIAEYAVTLLRHNQTLKRAICMKAAREDEHDKKLKDALERIRDYTTLTRDLREKNQEMQETIGYHRAAAERVRIMERRVDDIDFDRRAAIAESDRKEAQLRQQLAEQSRQMSSVREALDEERRRNAHHAASRVLSRESISVSGSNNSFDESLRHIHSTYSVDELARMSEEQLSKAINCLEGLSSKVRAAQDDIKDRKIKELELKERERKDASNDSSVCCICRDAPKSVLLLPCRHLCLCENCSRLDSIASCPMCRTSIIERLHVYA